MIFAVLALATAVISVQFEHAIAGISASRGFVSEHQSQPGFLGMQYSWFATM